MRYGLLSAIALMLLPLPVAAAPLDERLTALAEQGDPDAAYHLGMIYNNGIGVSSDLARALHWFQLAADRGSPLGAYKLGCYYDGQGEGIIAPDPKAALRYKLIAAEAGYTLAQDDVAAHYLAEGNRPAALRWLDAAAAQGDLTALFRIVILGGREPGPDDALRQYIALGELISLAGPDASPAMKADRDKLGTRLSSGARTEADRIVSTYTPRPSMLTLKAGEGLNAAKHLAGIH